MKKVVLILGFCLLSVIQADAQGFLNKLGNSVKEAVENSVERKAVQKAEEVTESVLEGKNRQNESESATEIESEIESDDSNVTEGNSNKVIQQKLSSTTSYRVIKFSISRIFLRMLSEISRHCGHPTAAVK